MSEQQFDVTTAIEDMDGGVFLQKIGQAMKDTALGVVIYGDGRKKGKVVIEFDIQRIGESSQVQITHTLKFDRPTKRGKISEVDTTETPFYVDNKGQISLMPHDQLSLFGEEA